ncbi:GGDEF domain-containing protein [Chenggangzhangella methanolivorans]|uniref:GGDEF domain-containing protein n=1 Tax=Chenggangzhangella methanolivorans TaxID=1437009 RepID=A0A9E6ULR3_9HYPH|nr:GGDEF domain-containing protein [Chenggangzhangella methanolivorans]QZO00842.1 GGDEF domain-containing protein [Chenggangzhangella methanolivorans]
MRSLGEGTNGAPLMGLAAAAVAGLVIRYGRGFSAGDALRLGAVRLAFAAASSENVVDAALWFGLDVVAICGAAGLFGWLRRKGFISSQSRVVAALGAAAVTMGVVQASPFFAAFGEFGVGFAAALVAASLAAMLIMTVTLSFDRPERRLDDASGPRNFQGEALAASALLTVCAVAAIADGRQEIALGASAVLMWFATRLGLFPTALAAFLLVSTLHAFGAGEQWSALAEAGPREAELMRGLALALLTLPALIAAAATHDQRRLSRDLAFRAFHDGLTTLANRTHFLETLGSAIEGARGKGRRFALFLVDLDHFKSVNDSFGHASGDALLVEVSRRLRDTVRATDMVARLGGDEFAVIAPVPTADDATRLAGRLVAGVNQAFVHDGLELSPTITVGVALAPDSTVDPERLMALADHALYEAKAAGRNCWRLCSAEAADAFAVDWNVVDCEPKAQIVYLD